MMTLGLNALGLRGMGSPIHFLPTELGLRQGKASSISVDLADSSPKILHQETQSLSLKGWRESSGPLSLELANGVAGIRGPQGSVSRKQQAVSITTSFLVPTILTLLPAKCPVVTSFLGV